MANSPRKKTARSLSRRAQKIKTNLGAVGGTINEMEEIDTKRLVCTSILRREGGDFETQFDYVLGAVDERLKDMEFYSGYEQLVEVEIEMPAGVQDKLIGWGELLDQEPEVSSREQIPMVARVSEHHYGRPLMGMWFPNHEDSLSVIEAYPLLHPGPIVFNPEIDGKITGNMGDRESVTTAPPENGVDGTIKCRLWVDPESTRTTAAQTLNRNYKSTNWKLSEAVHTLCQLCNRYQYFVINPTLKELEGVFKDDDEPIRNFSLPPGMYLNEALSALLKPHGYSWYLVPGRNEDQNSDDYGTTEIRIKIFRLGKGVIKVVNQPPPGDILDPAGKQNVTGWKLRQTFDSLRNRITAQGGLVQREVTIILERAWSEWQDGIEIEELMKTGADWVKYRDVWRKFVANEAGDLIGQRGITEGCDLSGVLGQNTSYRRREFGACLTRIGSDSGETRRRPPFVEYFAPLEKDEREVVTIKVFGAPATATFSIKWRVGAVVKEATGFDLTSSATDIETELTAQGVTGITGGGGTLGVDGLELFFEEDATTPHFWIEAEFTGGTKPAITIDSNRWKPTPEGWSPQLLETELGIYFAGDEAVQALSALGSETAIRITATVTGDDRLVSTAERQETSPMAHDVEETFDVSDRFFDRQLQRTGEFASKLIGAPGSVASGADDGPDERKDTTEIHDWTDRVQGIEDAVYIEGNLYMVGVRLDYEIGMLVRRIDGRKVSLNRKATDSGEILYPQITAILIKPLEQMTILYLEPLDQSEAEQRDFERRRIARGKKPGRGTK